METKLFYEMSQIENSHWWFAGRRRIVTALIKKKIPLKPTMKILDVGCGTGGNLEMLSKFGNVTGVDSDTTALELAKGKNIAPVVYGRAPDYLPFAKSSFDLVVLLDVLEHTDNDFAVLKELFSLLVPGGFLILTVPAFRFLWSAHDEEHHHRRRYALSGIMDLLRANNFNTKYLSYYNILLLPPIAIIRFLKSIMRTHYSSSDFGATPKIINVLLRLLFGSESLLVGRVSFPVGVSIICCAQRPV